MLEFNSLRFVWVLFSLMGVKAYLTHLAYFIYEDEKNRF